MASSENTHAKVLAAASQLFAKEGLKRTTTRHIAKLAGVNVSTLHYHFGDKNALYKRVVIDALEKRHGTWVEDKSATPAAKIHGWIQAMAVACLSDKDDLLNQLMAAEMMEPTEFVDLILSGLISPKMAVLKKTINEYLGAEVPDTEATRLCFFIVSKILVFHQNRPVVAALLPEMDYSEPQIQKVVDEATQHTLVMLDGLKS